MLRLHHVLLSQRERAHARRHRRDRLRAGVGPRTPVKRAPLAVARGRRSIFAGAHRRALSTPGHVAKAASASVLVSGAVGTTVMRVISVVERCEMPDERVIGGTCRTP